jgi:hypothetical protein
LTRAALLCGTVLTLSVALLSGPTAPVKASDTPPIGTTPRPIAKPDLIVSDVLPYYEFVYGTGWVLRNDKLWVQIYNNGNGDANAFTLLFQWDKGYSYQQQFYLFQGLKAGQSQWITVESKGFNSYTQKLVSYNLWTRGSNFEVYVDYGNAVNEWDETNNDYRYPNP